MEEEVLRVSLELRVHERVERLLLLLEEGEALRVFLVKVVQVEQVEPAEHGFGFFSCGMLDHLV